MSWTRPADLLAQVQRLWERGDLLRAAVSADTIWPLRLSFKTPNAADLANRFSEVNDWVASIGNMPHVRLEWRDRKHRIQGTQRLPEKAWLDSLADALSWLGKTLQAQRFTALWQQTAASQPALLPWLMRRPLLLLELADRWDRLLAIVAWLQAHPRPGIYLRQVDIVGVDSKFIETHKGVLSELLDLARPPEAINAAASGTARFAQRFGFLEKPVRIRFRLLDPALPNLPGCHGQTDITLDAASFAQLALPIEQVFITENETNFLSFPAMNQAIVVFGAGYGWEALSAARWLQQCRLRYWGDLDTHGFAILDQLRGHFPHVTTLLMDHDTLLAHRLHWGEETSPTQQDLPRLTAAESAVYDDLRFNRLQPRLRLEQERIGFEWLRQQLR